jgi:hypothetical protein
MTAPVDQTVLSASSFVSSIGVNTHVGYSWGAYNNLALVEDDLKYLGVTKLRAGLADSPSAQPVLDGLASAGYSFDLVVASSVPGGGTAALQQYIVSLEQFAAAHPGSIIALEGLNEANIQAFTYNGSSSIAAAAQFQAAYYAAIKGDAALAGIPVYNLSLGYNDQSDYAKLGNLSDSSDYGNSHAYVSTNTTPQSALASLLANAESVSGGHPVVITETGYTTQANTPYLGTDENVQAKSILNTLVDAYKDGVSTTYLYQLLDTGPASSTNSEDHFGLFNADGTPKLAATAVHNLTTILSDNGTGGHQPTTALGYSLSNMPGTGSSMVLGKSNGAYDLVVWAEPKIWNATTETEISNPAQTVTVNLGGMHHSVSVYDPMSGTSPIATYTDVSEITISLTDHPLVIEIDAPQSTAVAPAQPVDVSGTAVQIVAQLSALSTDAVLQTITLTDTHVLPVASEATMTYMISHYGKALAAIQGGYSFSVTTSTSTWSLTKIFDSSANLTSTSTSNFTNGVITSKVTVYADGSTDNVAYTAGVATQEMTLSAATGVKDTKTFDSHGTLTSDLVQNKDGSSSNTVYAAGVKSKVYVTNADGSHDNSYFNINGQNYTTQIQHYDAAGTLTADTRWHADGSLAYSFNANGTSKVTTSYDATGHKTLMVTMTAAATTTDKYDASGKVTQEVVQTASGNVTTTNYNGSVLSSVNIANADGSKEAKVYDSAGRIAGDLVQNKDGSSSNTVYAAGVKSKVYVTNADGSHDNSYYNIAGQTYTTQVQHYDPTGALTTDTRWHADGSLAYSLTVSGANKVTTLYDGTGHKTSMVTSTAAGTTTDKYDVSGKLTQEIVQTASGNVTTSNYAGSVLSSVYVVNADGSKDTKTYDSAGRIAGDLVQNKDGSSSNTLYTAGIKTKAYVTNADGSHDNSYFNITGQTYVTQVQHYTAAGALTADTRWHADGSLAYSQVVTATSKVTTQYDATGHKTSVVTWTAAATTTDNYDTSGRLTQEIVQTASGNVTTSNFSASLPTSVYIVNANGSKETKTYDSAGRIAGDLVQNKDGSSSNTIYTAGIKAKVYVTNADGSHDNSYYNIAGQTYTTQVQHYDPTGMLASDTRWHADGSLAYSQATSSTGKVTTLYDATGHKVSVTSWTSTATTTDSYDTSGRLTQEIVQTASGNMTTSNFSASLPTSVYIVNADGSKETKLYDSAGTITSDLMQNKDGSSTNTVYVAGVKNKVYVTNADGSDDNTYYNIAGQSYTTELQHTDATGKMTADTRWHADSTLAYSQVINSDGSKVTDLYDATGHKTSEIQNHADGSSVTDTYNTSGLLVQDVVKTVTNDVTTTNYSSGFVSSVYVVNADGSKDSKLFDSTGHLTSDYAQNTDGSSSTTVYSADVKTKMYVTNADGTHDNTFYNISGQTYTTEIQHLDTTGKITADTRLHADGTLDLKQVLNSDGSKVTQLYDSTGSLTQKIENNANGTSDVYKYVVTGQPGAVEHDSLAANGTFLQIDLLNANGTHSVTAVTAGQILQGGSGNDLFSAAPGSTTIAFDHGNDQINNFHAGTAANHDTIEIAKSLAADYSHLQITQSGSDTLIHVSATDTIVLKNVYATNLDHSNFVFA